MNVIFAIAIAPDTVALCNKGDYLKTRYPRFSTFERRKKFCQLLLAWNGSTWQKGLTRTRTGVTRRFCIFRDHVRIWCDDRYTIKP